MTLDNKLEIDPLKVKTTITDYLRLVLEKRNINGLLILYRHCIEAIINVYLAIDVVGKNNVTIIVDQQSREKKDINAINRYFNLPENNIIVFNQERVLKEIREIYSQRYGKKTRHVFDMSPVLNYNLSYFMLREITKKEMEQKTFTPSKNRPSTQREKYIQKTIAHYKSQIRLQVVLAFLMAETENQSVIGVTNKTEFLLGFFTKFGTYYAADFLPLAGLYQTQVNQLATHLNLQDFKVHEKNSHPSIYDYFFNLPIKDIDRILIRLENNVSINNIANETGISLKSIENVNYHYKTSEHARSVPLIPKM